LGGEARVELRRFFSIYDSRFTIDGFKDMKLVFLHGLPGVGKLTVARELARLTGFRLFHNHLTVDLVGSVFEFGSAPFVELREQTWLAVFRRAAEEEVPGLVFTFVFERTVRDEFIGQALGEVESRGGEVLFAELVCRRDVLEGRLTDIARAQFGKLRSVEFLDELLSGGRIYRPDSLPRPNFTLDTTDLGPSEAAARIVEHFGL